MRAPRPRQAVVDLRVRVLVKQLGQLGLEQGDLAVELGQYRHGGCRGRPKGVAEQGRSDQLRSLQVMVDELCPCLHTTFAPSLT